MENEMQAVEFTAPETDQFINMLFGIVRQGVTSFNDGAQLSDAPDFIDELSAIPEGINGLTENFKAELLRATPESVDALFNGYKAGLIDLNVQPMLANTVVSALKTIYSAIAMSAQSSAKAVEQVSR